MKSRVFRLLTIYASFVILFMIAKPVFILCNTEVYSRFTTGQLASTILHGLRMDLSMAGYLTIIPAIMLIAGIWTRRRWPELIITIWRYTAVALIVLTVMTDAILYGYWHFKLDTTPIFYFLTSPQAAMASTAAWVPYVAFLAAAVLTAAIGRVLGYLWNMQVTDNMIHGKVRATVVCGIMTAALFIPIRGGVTVSTMNPSAAYFSTVQELNHAAVNPMFSLLYSATHQNNFSKEFRYFSEEEKTQILDSWIAASNLPASETVQMRLIDTIRPDIYFIILESFSSHLMPSLGGSPVAVNLDSIARESVTLTNFYASSFRTDRAIPAILSGYPAQPSTSIMKFVERTDNLPSISRTLRDSLGYRTAYYYGGDIHFVNQKAYLVSSGFETIVSDTDFPISKRLSKWGAHDDVVFDRLWDDISADTSAIPVMRVIQTSSSHEPFEVPYEAPQFTDQRAVAFAYADKCLGDFMRRFRKSERWKNALVIIVPDHWGAYPRDLTDPVERHRIPLVITGGAVDSSAPMTLGMPASQNDIAATLLAQLGLSHKEFPLSHNFLDASARHYAFFSEPDFAAVITENDTTVISTRDDTILKGSRQESANFVKAFLQNIYDDLSKR